MSSDRVEQLIALGREHYNAGELERAEPFLAEAASARPSRSEERRVGKECA